MSAFISAIDLASLTPARGVRILGAAGGDRSGYSLSSAGDVNGDGFADLVIGMDPQNATASGTLTAYVVFGRANGWGDIDLGNLGTSGFRITGAAFDGAPTTGLQVSNAGDFNGDGFGDLLIGSPRNDSPGRTDNGAAWIVYGKADGFYDINLQLLPHIEGKSSGDLLGRSASSVGDFNGDGYADVVLGAQNYPSLDGSGFAGSAFLVFGRPGGPTELDLTGPGTHAYRIDGAAGDDIGRIVASAGDINGDGLADIVTGGDLADANGRTDSGSAFVVFGKASAVGVLNLNNLGQGGFRIDGASAGDQTGISVASIGDLNGDGFTDIAIGAAYASNNGRTNSGSVYVIYGHAGGFQNIDLANPGSYAFRIDGSAQYDYAGFSVAAAGDVNGDGYADLLLGGFNAGGNARFSAGAAWLLLGRAGGYSNIDLSITNSAVTRIDGAASGDRLGGAVAAAGDADGDGFSDILLGALTADPAGRTDAGAAYLLFSQSQGNATYRGTTLADELRGTPDNDSLSGYGQNDRLYGNAGNDTLDGGAGDDLLDGGPGNDQMAGGPGDDTYFVDNPGDSINEATGAGDDTAWINLAGGYTLAANIEIARLWGAGDAVTGSGGDEQLVANAAVYSTLTGGGGNDTLWGTAKLSALVGGEGDDVLRGGSNGDLFIGGTGNDQYVVPTFILQPAPPGSTNGLPSHDFNIGGTVYTQSGTPTLVEKPGEGIDTAWIGRDGFNASLSSPLTNGIAYSNIEIFRLFGTAIALTGSESDEQLVANPLLGGNINARGGNDVLWGSTGADVLNGDNGDDILRGQGGADTLYGGTGNDQFVILDNAAVIIEAPGEGDDTAWVAVNGYHLGENVERINLSGLANTAIGNASDNIIAGNPLMANDYLVGGAGADIIFGSSFADTFRGDAGNDILYSLGGADRFLYQGPGWGYDQINGFVQGAAKLDFTGSGIGFSDLFIQSANGNSQVEYGGSAILVFGVSSLSAADFLF